MKLFFQMEKELHYALYDIMGFYPRNLRIYKVALKHRSLNDGENNERLEFLGDAILNAIVSDILYNRFSEGKEGQLTQVRSCIVSRENLGRCANEMALERLVRSNLTNDSSHNSYMAGNALEALLGAIYLDRGYKYCKTFIEQRILHNLNDVDVFFHNETNHKSKLMEWVQKRHLTIRFEVVQYPDPDPRKSSPVFHATVYIKDIDLGKGHGYSKKQATQEAAKETLEMLCSPKVLALLK